MPGKTTEGLRGGPVKQFSVFTPNKLGRLHDLDRKWPWLLIFFTGIGLIVLLVWFCRKGTTGPNRFGDDPLAADDAALAIR